ncbi:hypothetical protein PFISCL1PPCAC_24173, partial [Pristionchus fissidentatus]
SLSPSLPSSLPFILLSFPRSTMSLRYTCFFPSLPNSNSTIDKSSYRTSLPPIDRPFVIPKKGVNYQRRRAKWQMGLDSYHKSCLEEMNKVISMQEEHNSFISDVIARLHQGIPINPSCTLTVEKLNPQTMANQWSIADEYMRGVNKLEGRRRKKQLRGEALETFDAITELRSKLKKLKEESIEITNNFDQISDRFAIAMEIFPVDEEDIDIEILKNKKWIKVAAA